MIYSVKVTIMHAHGRIERAGNGLTFASFDAADRYGLELMARWTYPDGYTIWEYDPAADTSEMIATRSRFGALEMLDRLRA